MFISILILSHAKQTAIYLSVNSFISRRMNLKQVKLFVRLSKKMLRVFCSEAKKQQGGSKVSSDGLSIVYFFCFPFGTHG